MANVTIPPSPSPPKSHSFKEIMDEHFRLNTRNWLWRALVRAIPTCTLWHYNAGVDGFMFRPWPKFYIGYHHIEMVDNYDKWRLRRPTVR